MRKKRPSNLKSVYSGGHEALVTPEAGRTARPRDGLFFLSLTQEGRATLIRAGSDAVLLNQREVWQAEMEATGTYLVDAQAALNYQEILYEILNMAELSGGTIVYYNPAEPPLTKPVDSDFEFIKLEDARERGYVDRPTENDANVWAVLYQPVQTDEEELEELSDQLQELIDPESPDLNLQLIAVLMNALKAILGKTLPGLPDVDVDALAKKIMDSIGGILSDTGSDTGSFEAGITDIIDDFAHPDPHSNFTDSIEEIIKKLVPPPKADPEPPDYADPTPPGNRPVGEFLMGPVCAEKPFPVHIEPVWQGGVAGLIQSSPGGLVPVFKTRSVRDEIDGAAFNLLGPDYAKRRLVSVKLQLWCLYLKHTTLDFEDARGIVQIEYPAHFKIWGDAAQTELLGVWDTPETGGTDRPDTVHEGEYMGNTLVTAGRYNFAELTIGSEEAPLHCTPIILDYFFFLLPLLTYLALEIDSPGFAKAGYALELFLVCATQEKSSKAQCDVYWQFEFKEEMTDAGQYGWLFVPAPNGTGLPYGGQFFASKNPAVGNIARQQIYGIEGHQIYQWKFILAATNPYQTTLGPATITNSLDVVIATAPAIIITPPAIDAENPVVQAVTLLFSATLDTDPCEPCIASVILGGEFFHNYHEFGKGAF